MGSNDIPPAHVPSSYHTVSTMLLGLGALGYTITYTLMTRQSLRDRTYAMPLLSLCFNFAWEIIFSLYVAESLPEKATFVTWMILDIGLVYTTVKYGANEWKHAPIVGRNIGKILALGVLWWCWALWAVCVWWVDELDPVKPKAGKMYRGKEGPDTTELGYWTALVAQVVLSVALLAQIVVRGTSGGASYGIWWTRFLGSLAGLNTYYGYCWYVWPEAHAYYRDPFSVCLLVTWVGADLAYFVFLRKAKRVEADGRKVPRKGGAVKTA